MKQCDHLMAKKCLILRALNKFHLLPKDVINSLDFYIKKSNGKLTKAEFVDISKVAEKYIEVKPRSLEEIEMPQIFNFTTKGSFWVDYPEIYIWKFHNSRVFHQSDFIQVGKNEVVWPKRDNFNFSKNLILDSFIYKYDYNECYILKPLRVKKVDYAFSLLGVHANVWSHSVWEYIPKLFQLKNLLKKVGHKLTVLVPDYGETHLKEIVYGELLKLDVDIVVVYSDEAVDVKNLYFMERAAKSTDNEYYVGIGDFTQPRMNAEIWKNEISVPMIEKYVDDKDKAPSLKLYLPRNNGGYRMMTNNAEIDQYYKDRGYVFVEPHKISFKEVVNLFYHAKIVAGPFSSAFTNLLFSRPGTKVFIMCNYTRAFEMFLEPFQQYYGIDIKWQLGYDVDKEHPAHSSYYIPMDKMKEACELYGIN